MLRAGVSPDSPQEVFRWLRENARRRRIQTLMPGRRKPPPKFERKGHPGTQTRGEPPCSEPCCRLHSNVRTPRFGCYAALRAQTYAAYEPRHGVEVVSTVYELIEINAVSR